MVVGVVVLLVMMDRGAGGLGEYIYARCVCVCVRRWACDCLGEILPISWDA